MTYQFQVRKGSMKFSDERAKTLLEVFGKGAIDVTVLTHLISKLGAMRVVKYFCYEVPFLKRT